MKTKTNGNETVETVTGVFVMALTVASLLVLCLGMPHRIGMSPTNETEARCAGAFAATTFSYPGK